MFTQCPHCQTIFRVSSAHLEVAQGHVRCSRCQHIFNASQYLMRSLPSTRVTAKTAFSGMDQSIKFAEADVLELLKDNTRTYRHRSWTRFFGWMLSACLFAAVLAGQYLWFTQPDKVLQHPQLRPWLQRFCSAFLCTLPPTRDLSQFTFEKEPTLQIRADKPEVIQIDATFVNQAPFSQPYPLLQLTFKDTKGRPTAQRCFKPEDYLPPNYEAEEMKPLSPVHIRLELVNKDGLAENGNYEFGLF